MRRKKGTRNNIKASTQSLEKTLGLLSSKELHEVLITDALSPLITRFTEKCTKVTAWQWHRILRVS